MFDNLSERLQEIIRKTSGNDTLTEENMQDALREVRRALLEADVNLKVVKSFISTIKERAEGESVLTSVSPTQQLIKIVHDELANLLGKEQSTLNLEGNPALIMMLGLQGSGKTTSSAKLAMKLSKEGKKPLLVAADVYRPAAISQLKTLGEQTNTTVYTIDGSKDVQNIVSSAINYAKENNFNPVIIDTAGRLQIDNEMMAELLIIDRVFQPQEKLLVIDAMTGQEAINIAENFNLQLEISGVILTKLDGDSRGGAALSVVHCTNKPIKFTGMGEKIEPLNDFYPARMADRILGMGDIVSLVEKAQEVFDEKQAVELEAKMKKAEFSFDDFLKMQKQMKMFGSIENILGMLPIPGLNKENKEAIATEGEKQFKKIESFISSMTPKERANPELINSSRKKRISAGCGLPMHEINQIITQFDQMRKMMKGFSDVKEKVKKGKLKIPKGMGNMPTGFGKGFPFK
ncbi:MAG: signal recognition particle protein [Candidatus Gastranaerophilales bacterium]|nr:signal recognition particle protein [Candidatus Gastranaerophilales bacterium]